MYGCFELAVCFLLAAKGSQAMLVLSTVEAQLSLHKHNIYFPEAWWLTTNPEPRSETAGATVLCTLCRISELHDNLCRSAS